VAAPPCQWPSSDDDREEPPTAIGSPAPKVMWVAPDRVAGHAIEGRAPAARRVGNEMASRAIGPSRVVRGRVAAATSRRERWAVWTLASGRESEGRDGHWHAGRQDGSLSSAEREPRDPAARGRLRRGPAARRLTAHQPAAEKESAIRGAQGDGQGPAPHQPREPPQSTGAWMPAHAAVDRGPGPNRGSAVASGLPRRGGDLPHPLSAASVEPLT
jgi:hypothetical protein